MENAETAGSILKRWADGLIGEMFSNAIKKTFGDEQLPGQTENTADR